MLSSLANYLLGGSPSAHDVSGDDQNGIPLPVETRLNQVEVEGDDWILIDRAGESKHHIIVYSKSNIISKRHPFRAMNHYVTIRYNIPRDLASSARTNGSLFKYGA